MRKTPVLFKHNINRLTKLQWYIRGNVKVIPTKTEEILKSHGCEVIDVKNFLFPPKEKKKIEVISFFNKELPKDQDHPDYKTEPCHILSNKDVLINGLEQAKKLTNTVEICEGLPKSVIEKEKSLDLPQDVHEEMIRKIKLSNIFEASQDKLPRRKDPSRPAWVFNREYGITDVKRNDLLCKNLAVICEQYSQYVNNKSVILDCFFSTPIEMHNKKIKFELKNELVVTSKKKLKTLVEPDVTVNFDLLERVPEEYALGITPSHFYEMEDIYPPGSNSKWPYIQMAFLHYNPTQVKNKTEEEVTETQMKARILLNGFCIAVAEARAVFGSDVKKLPEPVVVPVVQTDGKIFDFAIYQLNTLDLEQDSPIKNIFWHSERIPLFETCGYQAGRPVFSEYNPDVIKKVLCFYNIE